MIDVRLHTLGRGEIAAKLADAGSGLRDELRDELAQIGEEIVSRAQSAAPKKTGVLASRIAWYFGEIRKQKVGERGKHHIYRRRVVDAADRSGRITFTVKPGGSVAHLMERGVSTTRDAHFRRVTRTNVTIWTRRGQRTLKTLKGKAHVREHPFNIKPRPFFQPAVDSVGGAAGVNARLQARLDFFAGSMSRAS